MSNNAKLVRSQLRQIVKEMFPELVSTELYTEVRAESQKTLELVLKLAKETLERIESRQKDIQGLVMRELAASVNAKVPKTE